MIFDYETAQKMAKTHECSTCGYKSSLVVRFYQGQFDLYCPICKNGEHFAKKKSITQMWREDPGSVPLTIANKLEKKYGGSPMTSTEIMTADERTLLQRMEGCRWSKDMQPAERRMFAGLAIRYGLDPLMGHLVWYEGKPLVALDGHINIANRNPKFKGVDARPMTAEEKTAYGLENEPYAWICYAFKEGMQAPSIGTGTANPNKPYRSKLDPRTGEWIGGNIVERERPWSMARARSINQALRVYFPLDIPGVGYAEDAGITVDGKGNIIDGSFRVVPEDAPQAPQAEVTEAATSANSAADPGKPASDDEPLFAPVDEHVNQPDPPLFAPTAREETIKRIDDLCYKLSRSRDESFMVYFQKFTNVEWDKATDDQLDHFLSHMTDVYEEGKQKKREKAKSG